MKFSLDKEFPMLYLVGLGLGDLEDLTIKGRAVIESADEVVLEHYTSILSGVSHSDYEKYFARPVTLADREFVEGEQIEQMILRAKSSAICFLVVGDPFCATTHSDLVLRARNFQVPVQVIHNASIISAVGCCGLQMYRFGEIISVPLWRDNWRPDSFYPRLAGNFNRQLHTLCLLDIKVKERSEKGLMTGKPLFEPPVFMTASQAVHQLAAAEQIHNSRCFAPSVTLVALARVGKSDQTILAGSVQQFLDNSAKVDQILAGPLHSLVVCADHLHELEADFIAAFRLL